MSAAAVPASGSSDDDDKPTGLRQRIMTISLILAPLIQVFDTSLMSVSLKHMQGSLSATQDQMAWVLTSYLIALAVMTPLWGAISQKFGRKKLLLISIVGFMFFSLLSGTSQSLAEILTFRFMQGVFGAALIPLTQSALLSIYKKEDFSIAMGWWGVGIMFGPVFGPTLGGYITEYFSWRWAFYLNVPISMTAFIMIYLMIPRQGQGEQKGARPFTYFGFIALGITVACIQFILDRGQRLDWFSSPMIVMLALIGASSLWVFLVHSWTSDNPLVDPSLFRDKNYMSGIVLRVLFGIFLFGSLVLVPPFLQNQGGYPLVDSGIVMAWRGAGSMCSALIVGRILQLVDPRRVILVGMTLSASTMWIMGTFTQDIDEHFVYAVNFVQGISLASFIVPVNSIAFSTLTPAQRDIGTSFYSLLNNMGRSLGIALLASYLARNTQENMSMLTEKVTMFNDAARHGLLPNVWDLTTQSGLAAINRVVFQQAELIAYINDFRLLSIIIVCCMPVVILMNNPHTAKPA